MRKDQVQEIEKSYLQAMQDGLQGRYLLTIAQSKSIGVLNYSRVNYHAQEHDSDTATWLEFSLVHCDAYIHCDDHRDCFGFGFTTITTFS